MERAVGENARLILPMIMRRRMTTGADASGLRAGADTGLGALRGGAPVGTFSSTGPPPTAAAALPHPRPRRGTLPPPFRSPLLPPSPRLSPPSPPGG